MEGQKMTETIQQLKEDIALLQMKLQKLEEKSPVEEAYKEVYGRYPPTSPSVSNYEDNQWSAFQNGYEAAQKENVVEEPTKPMDEVVDRLIKKYQAQKLWNMVRDELGYSIDLCDEIVDLVEKWLPKEQSAEGSQNVDTELLVDGFNDAIRKMKEMLR
jgi:hypothetical protein